MIAAALLCSSQAVSSAQSHAQSSGNGVSNFLGNIFSGPKSAPGAAGRARPGRRPAALERRGRRLRPSPDDGVRDPGGGRELSKLRRRDVARCRTPQHHAGKLSSASPRGSTPDLRIMDLMDSQPEFTKAIWDYLDILVNDNRLAKGREILAKYKPQFDAVEKAYGVDRYIDRLDLGHRVQLLDADGRPQRAAIRPRRWPASAAARPISRTNSSPRWKSSTAAICVPNRCAAPGPARSGRRSSCRPPSSAMPSMPTATAAATSSTIPPT